MRILRTLAVLPFTLLAAPLAAQAISGSFSPNPALVGEPITFTGTDATGEGFTLYSPPCTWFRVHAGTPDGPLLPLLQSYCVNLSIVNVGPDGSYTMFWDQKMYVHPDYVQVPPGTYWFEMESAPSEPGAPSTDWFSITIQDPGAPALMQTGPVRLGSPAALEISSPSDPFARYALAASWTSNRPLTSLDPRLSLSRDSLLDLSLRRPSAVFVNGRGLLDGNGRSSGIAVRIPDMPALAYQGIHVQGLIGTSTGLKITNDLSLTIRP